MQRKANDEFASRARTIAVGVDCAAVHFDQTFHECQPDSQAALARLATRSTCMKMSNIRGSISVGIPTPESRTARMTSCPSRLHGEPNLPARIGVLGGIVEQIGEGLGPGELGSAQA